MPYGLYLPPGYDGATARYPVLYLLHGIGGHYSEWAAYGLLEAAERLIASGRIEPIIIVLAQGDESYFANHPVPGGARWGDYLAHDLVAHIDATYRTVAGREARGVGGLSMGGFGALHLAFAYPEVFGVVGAHSPSLRTHGEAPWYLGDPLAYARLDPMQLARAIDPARAPRIWIDVGVADEWAVRTSTLKDDLRARGIRPEYRETAGGHDAAYWRQNAGSYLRFYAAAMGAVLP
jgi:enterochelin esterase-like enzyme